MREQEFAPGDVVRCKAGGPAMCIQCISDGGVFVTCQWFTPDRELHSEIYLIEALEQTTPDPWEAGKA